MSIADKLTQIAENEQRVYNAGYTKGKSEGGGGGAKPEIDARYDIYDNGERIYIPEDGKVFSSVTVNVDVSTDEAYSEGYNEGKTDGYAEGYEIGKADGVKPEVSGSFEISKNGDYTYTPESGKVFSNVSVSVNVPNTDGSYDEGYADGKKAEYDAFWDDFQKNGTEYINYGYAFGNKDLWTQEAIEKIKYKHFLANYFSVVFISNTSITDLSAFSLETGQFGRLAFSSTFNGCTNLKKCMPIDCGKVYAFINAFNGCSALEELILSGNIFNSGLDLKWSKKLNKASLTSVINCLEIGKTGQSVTLSLTAVNNAFETSSGAADGSTSAEWTALVATRPSWTISLADA